MRHLGVSLREQRFQRLKVSFQMALEDGLRRGWEGEEPRLVLCERGSLDLLAYWLARGWEEAEFFPYTATTRSEHYARYAAVLHLVTAAEGAAHAYRRYPADPRDESPEEAVRLDHLLYTRAEWHMMHCWNWFPPLPTRRFAPSPNHKGYDLTCSGRARAFFFNQCAAV